MPKAPKDSNPVSQWAAALNINLGKVTGMDKVSKAVQKAADEFKVSPKNFKELEKVAMKSARGFFDTIGKARATGLSKDADRLERTMQRMGDDLVKDVERMAKIELEMQGEVSEEERKTLSLRLQAIKNEASIRSKQISLEMEAVQKVVSRRTEAMDDIRRFSKMSKGEKFEAGAGVAEGFFNSLARADASDMEGMAKALVKAVGKGGGLMEGLGASMGGEKGLGKTLMAVGAGLGKANKPLLALTGVLAAVTAALLKADSHVKDFNKDILEGAGAADLALTTTTGDFMDLNHVLEDVRHTAREVALEFKQQPKDILKVINAANEAGLTFGEMTERFASANKEVSAFTRLAEMAVIQSKSLGISTDEVAQTTAQWTHDFGGGLTKIEEGFSAIFQGAMESGMGAKRFYGFVTQATSGLALYNARIEEASALITLLADSMGEATAAELVGGLQKGFANEDYQTRVKRLMMMDKSVVNDIFRENASVAGVGFGKMVNTLADSAKGKIVDAFKGQFGGNSAMIHGITMGDPAALKELASMTTDDRRALVGAVTEADAAAGRQLQTLIGATEGLSGNMMDQAKAMDELGAGGVLAMQINSASAMIGKDLDEMSGRQLLQFEQMTGYQGEQLHQLQRMVEQMKGEYGIYKQGAEAQGEVAQSFEGWLIHQGDRIAEQIGPAQTLQEQMTQSIIDSTTSTAEWLRLLVDVKMVQLLELINKIYEWLPFRKKQQGPSTEQQTVLEEIGIRKRQQENIKARAERELSRVGQEELDSGQTGETVEARRAAEKAIRDADAQLEALTLSEERVTRGGGGSRKALRERAGLDAPEMTREQEKAWGARESIMKRDGSSPEEIATAREGYLQRIEEQKHEDTLAQTEAIETGDEAIAGATEEGAKDTTEAVESVGADVVTEQMKRDAAAIGRMSGIEDPQALGNFVDSLMGGQEWAQTRASEVLRGEEPAVFAQFGPQFGLKGGGGGGKDAPHLPWIDDPVEDLPWIDDPVEDFIMRGNTVTPINTADDLIGGKAGGPLAGLMGGGVGGTVQININGGDTQRIYSVVKRALQESGVRPPPGSRTT